ncbi:Retrovirus-related Pol polyprotein from transposon 17.6 [Vitis vinifera]|uniref:Retrovirus-related Pol polyprotein from transposon 17.6 n=1 Tax=Vitis vinifera TaxID=29760 RepID=A0A438H900_VITVI|nr:Retrovirus-related Pol polyprotein from transposon 17.6 [Vitis vinifera]
MTRRLEELELKKIHEVQAISETPVQVMPCSICQSYEHLVEECPTIPAVREMFGDQANVIGQFKPNNNASYGNTYNSNWRNHPNFSWKPRALQYMMDGMQNDLSQKIDNLQYSISRLTNLNTVQEKGRFPSQPHQNPNGIHEVEAHEGKSSQCKSPVKYKDSGCPIISVMIRGKLVEKTLLNLGASVNLLPYSVYKQLGLGELKPTSITLSLVDRSVKIPRGMIEDVLVQVDNFYYLVDFVVLDTDPIVKGTNYVPIILGRPFLATSNAIIDCRNGLMQLMFGNMTLELNIFYMCKKPINPEEKEGPEEEQCLLEVLRRCKKAIGWQISYLKGISPLACTHHIYMEEEAKPVRQPQRRLNPHMQEVVRAEVLKLLQAEIDVEDQEKTIFTCPFGTYAYRRMSFGLCNAPATFQRCMLSIFSDMVEHIMEVFMDDIIIYGSAFEECLVNLEAVLNRCIEKDLVLNWEKCHFMVHQGIVLGHIISKKGIEVDKTNVELIVKLPSLTTVKGVRQFLGHVGFYRRFIKDFSKLSKPLCELLVKDAKFVWDERCQKSFEQLK